MATITLANLRSRTRQRANMENSTFVTDAEFNIYINYSINFLKDILISKVGNDYFASSVNFTLVNGTEAYSLPADFYKILYVEILGDDTYYYKMRRFEISEKNYGASPINYYIPDIRYRLRADSITFTPQNLIGGRTVRLTYVPVPVALSADSDTMNGLNGWDEYVVLMSARKALVKEEQDVSQIDQELMMLNQKIEAMADNRDESNPMRVSDNTSYYADGWSWRY
jgi:hypothetical protein